MAINVTNVNSVVQGITNMSDYGSKAATCFSKISEELKDFNKVWKGGIYERVANSFDSIVDDFNGLTNYITVEVPDVINSSMEYMASVNEVTYTPPAISAATRVPAFTLPSFEGGVHITILSTPATFAGTTFMRTLDG